MHFAHNEHMLSFAYLPIELQNIIHLVNRSNGLMWETCQQPGMEVEQLELKDCSFVQSEDG